MKSPDEVDRTYLAQAVDSVRERSKTLVEMTQWLRSISPITSCTTVKPRQVFHG